MPVKQTSWHKPLESQPILTCQVPCLSKGKTRARQFQLLRNYQSVKSNSHQQINSKSACSGLKKKKRYVYLDTARKGTKVRGSWPDSIGWMRLYQVKRQESGSGQKDREMHSKSMCREENIKHLQVTEHWKSLNHLKLEPSRSDGHLKTKPGNAGASLKIKWYTFGKSNFASATLIPSVLHREDPDAHKSMLRVRPDPLQSLDPVFPRKGRWFREEIHNHKLN